MEQTGRWGSRESLDEIAWQAMSTLHSIGKNIRWLQHYSMKLSRLATVDRKIADPIRDLSEDTLRAVEDFMKLRSTSAVCDSGQQSFDMGLKSLVQMTELRGLRLLIHCPPSGRLRRWRAPDAVLKALVHVVENSIDASERGSCIHLTARVAGDEAFLAIRDQGSGMNDACLARCLEPGYSSSGEASGRGMGLAVAKGLLESNGGRIDVESTLEIGTTVTIRVPMGALP